MSIEVNNELLGGEKILTKIINQHYINIVEKSSGTKPSLLEGSTNPLLEEITVGKIIDTYQDHQSVMTTKSSVIQNSKFNLRHGTTQVINQIINFLSSDKVMGPDDIKLKLSANVIMVIWQILYKDVDLSSVTSDPTTSVTTIVQITYLNSWQTW